MKHFLNRVYRNRVFLLFILLFAYIHSIYTRVSVRHEVNAYTFTPEAAIATFVNAGILFIIILFFIRKWLKTESFQTKIILRVFGVSLVAFVITMNMFSFLIALAFGKIEHNFNQQTFFISFLSDLLDGLIYGSFFLSYYYFNHNKQHQLKLASSQQALAESKINQLKAQLNPHFLFNNLNILDQLIDEDKQQASDFLNEFAEIYRYILQVSERDLVSIEEELDFVKQYFKLIQYKYGQAYQLDLDIDEVEGLIVPLTLQLLVENAVQHNLGTIEKPVLIKLKVYDKIIVSNNINYKKQVKTTSGRALNNLKQQYQLLTKESMSIENSSSVFSVSVPIIKTQV